MDLEYLELGPRKLLPHICNDDVAAVVRQIVTYLNAHSERGNNISKQAFD